MTKVLHISTSDNGGAGLAAYRLHRELLSHGVDSKMLVVTKSVNDNTVIPATPSPELIYQTPSFAVTRKIKKILRRRGMFQTRMERIQREMDALSRSHPDVFFTSAMSVYDLSQHPLVRQADIIHLHWVQNFLNYDTFFENVKKPIVWTLHDLNPLYGGFHHTLFREKYYNDYKNLEEEFYAIKRAALVGKTNITAVAISSQMHRLIANHEFFKDKPIVDIFNGVDYKQFTMPDKQSVRSLLGIAPETKVFLFANRYLNDSQKGLDNLCKAFDLLNIENGLFICLGEGDIPPCGKINVRQFKPVSNTEWLSQLYSAADYLVFPSLQEAFSLTTLEAMCCGTPVIMTPVSGSDDLINDFNGINCDNFTPEAIARGISMAMEKEFNREKIRKDVVSRFNLEQNANKYIKLYNSLSNSH
ncbi:MAG: glycosyltransferase [Bacteroidales bacterium]|nr:glycosyltransferase [Bacteroidales bacterium]